MYVEKPDIRQEQTLEKSNSMGLKSKCGHKGLLRDTLRHLYQEMVKNGGIFFHFILQRWLLEPTLELSMPPISYHN